MTRLLLRLYPPTWRSRYADEFEALLEERPLGPFDVLDVLIGAVDAHLHLRGLTAATQGRGLIMSLRVGGYAAVIGGLLWLVGFLIAQFDGTDAHGLGQWLVLAGTAGLLVALAGLSAVQSRRFPRLVWAAFAVPAFGTLATIAGLVGLAVAGDGPFIAGIQGWTFWIFGLLALIGGSGLFALVSWRTGALSHVGLALLGVAAAGLVAVFANAVGLLTWEPIVSIALLGLVLSFCGGWIVLGIGAVLADRRSSTVPAAGA